MNPSILPLFFSSTVPHFHLRFHHAREKETLKENPSLSSSLLLFSHRRRRVAVTGSPSLGRRRCVAGSPSPRGNRFTEKQSCHRAAVQSPSKTPVAVAVQLEHRAALLSPSHLPSPAKSNSTMSSSEVRNSEQLFLEILFSNIVLDLA
ncbi:uncharacterized protein DS421_11g348410 [Arachis hypogaea]|nr:uncharacterized protein DS421_11g348410 [Arachis hypogaea]